MEHNLIALSYFIYIHGFRLIIIAIKSITTPAETRVFHAATVRKQVFLYVKLLFVMEITNESRRLLFR